MEDKQSGKSFAVCPEGEIWGLDPALVLPNDIVLSATEGALGLGIRLFTWSDFTHAAICVDTNLLVDATLTGVERRPVTQLLCPPLLKFMVLRPLAGFLARDPSRYQPYQYANYYLERAYNFLGLPAPVMGIWPTPETPNLFCSQLVARAYTDAGSDLLPGVDSARVSPGLLVRSEFLQDVTGEVRRPVSPEMARMQLEAGAIVDADRAAYGPRLGALASEIARHWTQVEFGQPAPINLNTALEYLRFYAKVDVKRAHAADKLLVRASEKVHFFEWLGEEVSQLEASIAETKAVLAYLPYLVRADPQQEHRNALAVRRGRLESGTTEYAQLAWKNQEDLAATTGLELFRRYAEVEKRKYNNELEKDRLAEEYCRIVEHEIAIITSSQGT